MAPIDIIISIINRKRAEADAESNLTQDYKDGMIDAYDNLLQEFEGFKKLFN